MVIVTETGGGGQAPEPEKRCTRCDVLQPMSRFSSWWLADRLVHASHCRTCKSADAVRRQRAQRLARGVVPRARGRVKTGGRRRQPLRERFEAKVRRPSADACWEWTAYRNQDGYGVLGPPGGKGAPLMAHRVAWELYVGPVPAGLEIDHLCEVPWCVNPLHLEPVTHAENMRRSAWKRGQV